MIGWGSFVSVGEASRRLMKVPDPLMKVRFALNGLLWRAPTTFPTGDETPREVKWLPRPVRELRVR